MVRYANGFSKRGVLLMSGYAEDALEGRGLAGAGGAFLRKPSTPPVLTRNIREVLDGGSASRVDGR